MKPDLRILHTPEEMADLEELSRLVWPGSETDVVPAHLLLAVAHNGGVIIGAYVPETPSPVGFVFGFTAIDSRNGIPRFKHHSHQLGIHPEYRNRGLGFALKRAQWQMVRHQGLERITWTYDPLLSPNARLNITKLGAVCNTYFPEYYGEMRDELNVGIPSDRFQVDWWVNSWRVLRRLSYHARPPLDLANYLEAGVEIINHSHLENGWSTPPEMDEETLQHACLIKGEGTEQKHFAPVLLVEIPGDFTKMKAERPDLAVKWRLHTRQIFQHLFKQGYLVTDFIHLSGEYPRSFYALSHGEKTL